MARLPSHPPGHRYGLMITTLGVLVLSPDSLLVRLMPSTNGPWSSGAGF